MNKSAFYAVVLLLGVGLSGCPIYDAGDSGCYVDDDCPGGHVCDRHSGECVAEQSRCSAPSDCGTNETCSRSGSCVVGDCHFDSVGCVAGYTCDVADGAWQCVRSGSDAGASNGGAPSSSSGRAPALGGAGAASEMAGGAGGERAAAGAGG